MKTSTFFSRNILCFVIGIMTLSLSAQTIITIDNNPGSTTTHQTLQAALDDIETNSIADAVIYVQPSGNTYGNGTIDSPVTIVGRSHSEPGKKSIVGRINPRSSNITLKGLEISQLYYTGGTGTPAPPYSNLSIFECEINSTFYFGFSSSQTAATHIDGVIVRGCVIQNGLTVYADTADVLLSNNIFSSSQPLNVYNAATTVVTNNIFRYWSNDMYLDNRAPSQTLLLFNNMFIFIYPSTSAARVNFRYGDFNLTNNLTFKYGGTGDLNFTATTGGSYLDSFTLANTDPLFTNVDTEQGFADNTSYNPTTRLDDDLTLQATANGDPQDSPALTGGGGGSELGLYNNGFNYNIFGNPQGVPTIDVISYDGAVELGGNINVTINAKAN